MNNNNSSVLRNYSSPTTVNMSAEYGEAEPLSMFNTRGRIGRLRYITWSIKINFVISLIFGVVIFLFGIGINADTNVESISTLFFIVFPLLGLLILAAIIMITMKRLQDFNANKWLSLLMFVPIVNFILGLICLLMPGNERGNAYGLPEPPLTFVDKLLLCLLILPFIGIIAAILIPIMA